MPNHNQCYIKFAANVRSIGFIEISCAMKINKKMSKSCTEKALEVAAAAGAGAGEGEGEGEGAGAF